MLLVVVVLVLCAFNSQVSAQGIYEIYRIELKKQVQLFVLSNLKFTFAFCHTILCRTQRM